MKKTLIIAAAVLGSFAAQAQSTWNLDKAHGAMEFSVNHMGLANITGQFKDFDVKVTNTKSDLSDAVVEMTATVASINTGNEGRDKHLQSADFFDAEKNPTITFKSTSFKKVKGNAYKVTGDLTMHGVTKTVTLDATFNGPKTHPYTKKEVAGFTVTGQVKRSDFGIAKEMTNDMLSDVVMLNASFEVVKG